MSLYNMMFGKNPISDLLLAMVGLTPSTVGRFRDAYLNSDGTEVLVYTRNGGGNREHWDNDCEPGQSCECTGCIITYALPAHPLYLRDWNDDFDCTYATIAFKVPEYFLENTKALATGVDPVPIAEKFQKGIERLKAMSADDLEREYPEMTALMQDLYSR